MNQSMHVEFQSESANSESEFPAVVAYLILVRLEPALPN
jgi:hypothetical protein